MKLPGGKTLPAPRVWPQAARHCPPTFHARQARPAARQATVCLPSSPLTQCPRGRAMGPASRPPAGPARPRNRGGCHRPARPSRPRPAASASLPLPAPCSPRLLPLGRRRLLHGGRGRRKNLVSGEGQKEERS